MQIDLEDAQSAYQNLSEQERELIREAMDSPLASVLSKVFPDLMSALGSLNNRAAKWTQHSGAWQQGC